jgi:hypothetical protein
MWRSGWLERDLIGDTSAHECATRLWLAAAARAAVRDRRLAALSLALAVGGVLSGLPLCWLAIPMMYLLRFALALLHGKTRRDALRDARSLPIELPPALSFSDEGAKRLIQRLERARWATESAAGAGPCSRAFALTGLLDGIPELERQVVVLAARAEYLGRFLDSSALTPLRTELVRLEHEREKEADPAVRAGLQRVITRCQEQLDTLQALTARKAAVLRTGEEILRTLEQVSARIVSLQLARVDSCDAGLPDALPRTDAIVEGFTALEQTIGPPDADASPQ